MRESTHSTQYTALCAFSDQYMVAVDSNATQKLVEWEKTANKGGCSSVVLWRVISRVGCLPSASSSSLCASLLSFAELRQ